jgi:cobalt-zinc-cadmium efflux system membrane fusion protein
MNGTVLERNVNPGENVDASMALFRIADLSTVWAEFTVFSRDLARIRPGLPIAIRTGDADLTVATTLSYVAATGHADTQSVMARAQVANTNNRWIAGQFVTGEVVTSEVKARVAVAASAIQVIKNAPRVFVQTNKGFEPRVVKLGQHDRESVEILDGVNAGDRYAGKNSYLIKADLLKSEADDE